MNSNLNNSYFELLDVTARYGNAAVLKNATIRFESHKLNLLVGPNGAGKSTLLRILAGLKGISKGSANFFDQTLKIAKPRISFCADSPMLYAAFSVHENLKLFAALADASTETELAVQKWQLNKILNRRVSELSRGERVRVQLALAFSVAADFILLDEPTNALDAAAREILRDEIAAHLQSSAIVIATHEPEFFANFPMNEVLLQNGQIVKGAV